MLRIFIIYFSLATILLSQNVFYVNKDGSGNFKTIKEVNNAKFSNGDIVSFKSGQQFDDEILICQKNVEYKIYGGSEPAILGNQNSNLFNNTLEIIGENVIINNFIIYGYLNAPTIITYSSGGWEISNCIIKGGKNAHKVNTIGIKSLINGYNGIKKIAILNNDFSELGKGLYVNRPYNVEIAYNKFHELWVYNGRRDAGGNGMSFFTNSLSDRWDANYTLHIHHNEIFNFEYAAIGVAVSRMIIEYNDIHSNLDERIFRGGVKHGSISKLFDNTGAAIGGIGTIFRYNYVHDLVRRGQANYTYGKQTQELIDSRTFTTLSTDNGTGYSLYKESNSDGSDWGGQPDAAISGLGYGNVFIYNNVFENISNQIFARGYSKIEGDPNASKITYSKELASYFFNNTILNCGYSYAAKYNSLIYIDANAQSPTFIINNIFDYINNSAFSVIKGQETEDNGYYVNYNIYLNQSGQQKGTSIPSNVALWEQYGSNYSNGDHEKYFTNPNWSDESSLLFASNIGPAGVYIPDVRIKSGGNAFSTGMEYGQIGDKYNGYGKDPTGRSFAYDILGNFRLTNDIGALGTGSGNSIIPPNTNYSTPVITEQPKNNSTNIGGSVIFTITATCDDEIGYQWWKSPYISDSESKINNNSKYSGANSNTLVINNIEEADANKRFVCEVYNKNDHDNSWVNSQIVALSLNSVPSTGNDPNGQLTVLLEAPFKDNNMNANLAQTQNIPLSQPYNSNPWLLSNSQTVSKIELNYIDWIIIELRSSLEKVDYRKPAILTISGKVINSDGTNLSFENIVSNKYYVVIKHRNHLSIMSSTPIQVNNEEAINYNFTDAQTKAYGNNSMVKLENGKFAMYAGDSDANGVVNNLDFGIIANNIPFKGYTSGDLDMNGIINVLDYSLINKNILKKTYVPK